MIHLWHRYGPWTDSDTCSALIGGRWLRMEHRRCRRCATTQTRQGTVIWHRSPVPDIETREPAGLPDDTPDLRTLAAEAVMGAMGWADDRQQPATHDVPAAPCWTLAGEVADAVLAVAAGALHRVGMGAARGVIEGYVPPQRVGENADA